MAIAYGIGQIIQVAQLSQIDRAAGWVIVMAKSGRLELGDNILRTLQVHLQPYRDVIGQQSNRIRRKNAK